jgi:hypothetical protein
MGVQQSGVHTLIQDESTRPTQGGAVFQNLIGWVDAHRLHRCSTQVVKINTSRPYGETEACLA